MVINGVSFEKLEALGWKFSGKCDERKVVRFIDSEYEQDYISFGGAIDRVYTCFYNKNDEAISLSTDELRVVIEIAENIQKDIVGFFSENERRTT